MTTLTAPAPAEAPAPAADDDVVHHTDATWAACGAWLAGRPGVEIRTLCGLVATDGDSLILGDRTPRPVCPACADVARTRHGGCFR